MWGDEVVAAHSMNTGLLAASIPYNRTVADDRGRTAVRRLSTVISLATSVLFCVKAVVLEPLALRRCVVPRLTSKPSVSCHRNLKP